MQKRISSPGAPGTTSDERVVFVAPFRVLGGLDANRRLIKSQLNLMADCAVPNCASEEAFGENFNASRFEMPETNISGTYRPLGSFC